jgi:hypothetical protein
MSAAPAKTRPTISDGSYAASRSSGGRAGAAGAEAEIIAGDDGPDRRPTDISTMKASAGGSKTLSN